MEMRSLVEAIFEMSPDTIWMDVDDGKGMVVREEVGGGEIDEARYLLMTNVASEPSLSKFAAPGGGEKEPT